MNRSKKINLIHLTILLFISSCNTIITEKLLEPLKGYENVAVLKYITEQEATKETTEFYLRNIETNQYHLLSDNNFNKKITIKEGYSLVAASASKFPKVNSELSITLYCKDSNERFFICDQNGNIFEEIFIPEGYSLVGVTEVAGKTKSSPAIKKMYCQNNNDKYYFIYCQQGKVGEKITLQEGELIVGTAAFKSGIIRNINYNEFIYVIKDSL